MSSGACKRSAAYELCSCSGPDACVPGTSPERCRLVRLVEDCVAARPLTVELNAATERRLRLMIERFNEQTPDDPLDPASDGDLAVVLLGCADSGLAADEADHGLESNAFGDVRELPAG